LAHGFRLLAISGQNAPIAWIFIGPRIR